MKYSIVYVTVGSKSEASEIAKSLIEKKLAGCVNILGDITSYYMWEGKVQNEQEVSLIIKTTNILVDKVIEAVKEIHSYSCPCIVSVPIEKGNNAFLDWIESETI